MKDKMVCLSSFLLLILTLQSSVSLKTLQYYNIEENIDIYQSHSTTEFSKLILFNGTIYAAGVNAIYKFSYDLQLLDKVETGPVLSSTECSPANDTCLHLKGVMKDTHPSIFLIHKKWGYLFHCGNTLQGFCEMYNAKNFSKFFSMPKDDVLSFAGGGGQNFAFLDDYKGQPAIHIGMGNDARPRGLRPMTLSTRFIKTRPLHMIYHQAMSFSTMDSFWNPAKAPVTKKLAQQYKIDFIYGFAHGKFFYFVTTHTVAGLSSAKLVRICEDDIHYFSHTELYLMCTDSGDNITHSKVVTALFDGNSLHVAFKKDDQSQCQYNINDIDNQFLKLQKDCYEGIEGTHTLPWVDHLKPPCVRDQRYEAQITKDFCGHRLNKQIGGDPHESGGLWNQAPPWKTTEKITDILVTEDIMVATESGHVIKITTDFELRGLAPPSFPVVAMVKGNNSDIIYATKNKIGKFSHTCSLYSKRCGDCVMVADTLGCGWCGDHCSKETSCNKPRTTWTKGCPPVIYNFLPKKGSIYGGTKLRIYGQDFGEKSQVKLSVTIGTVPCNVETWNSTRIVCKTKPTLRAFTNDIEVVAEPLSNHTKDYEIIGETTSGHETFMFVMPIVEEIFTKDFIIMQIKGDHLDLEAKIVIKAHNERTGNSFLCKLTSVYKTVIECKLPVASQCLTSKGIHCYLNITVDGASLPVPRIHLIGDFPIKEPEMKTQKMTSMPVYLLIAVTVIVFVIAVFIFVKCRKNVKICFKKINNDISMELTTLENNYEDPLVTNSFPTLPARRQILDETDVNFLKKLGIYIKREHLYIGETQLGKGHFGLVMKGTLKDNKNQIRNVAVKTLIPHSDIYEEGKLFYEEAIRMSDFQHVNVLDLVGIAVDGGQQLPLVVTPFMKHGDLLNFLMDEKNPLKVITLFDFGLQVARGMNYLSSLRFVHRDLAARNCLVDEQLVVKVADFGMSRDIYTKNYYHLENEDTPVPVKWMAPESIDYRKYTHMSDVWSFGVLLWEIMTRGKSPFAEFPYGSVLKHLKIGRRLEKPDYCPEELYSIMTWCWKWEPEERPTFEELESCLTNLLNELSGMRPHSNSGYADRPSVSQDDYNDDDDEHFSSIENELYMLPVRGAVGGISASGDTNSNPRSVFGIDNLHSGHNTENDYETPHSQPGKRHKYLQMDPHSFQEENPKEFLEKQIHVGCPKDTKLDEEPRYM